MTQRRRPIVFDMEEVEFEDDDAPFAAEPEAAPFESAEARPRRRSAKRGEAAGGAAGAAGRAEADPIAVPEGGGAAVVTPEPIKAKRRWNFMTLFVTGVSGLAGLALSISLYAFVEDLLARAPALGGLAGALAVLMIVGLLGMVAREWLAIRHLKQIEHLRRRADGVIASDDPRAAKAVLADLIELYDDRPNTARGRSALQKHMREVIDGRDLIALGEREVLTPLDRVAIGHVVSASRRVAAVTALSPRALVDIAFVIFAALTMVRRVATTYGGRPGTLGFFRVLRHAVAHLAVTGGMAATDSLIGEVIGKGIAAKMSARLGEGIVNGLMTARLGLATLDVLRPLPFHGNRRPRINDIMGEIAKIAPKDDK